MVTGNAINANSTGIVKYDGAGTFSSTTVTQHDVLIGGASNAITSLALTDGELAIGSTGNDPSAANLTPGTGISITNAPGSITINSVGAGLTWTVVTVDTTFAVNTGTIANKAGLLTMNLPVLSSVGDMIAITGINNATGWKIGQTAAGHQIFFGSTNTTLGAGGSLASTGTRDTIFIVCVIANTVWNVVDAIGNITVV